jgi:hypothetical protein
MVRGGREPVRGAGRRRGMARSHWYVAGAVTGAAVLPVGAVVVVLWLLGYLSPPAIVPRENTRFEQLTMVTSGGIAGGSRGVSLQPDGTYVRFVGAGEPAMATGRGRIGGDRLAGIRELATSARLAGEARRPGLRGNSGCMDGTVTRISMGDFRMSVYDCGDEPDVPTFRRLADRLGQLD